MEKNCGFDSLMNKLGRMREDASRQDITIGEVVTIANKYAATDKTPCETKEQQKNKRVSAGRNPGQNQNNVNQNSNNKRPFEEEIQSSSAPPNQQDTEDQDLAKIS